MYRSRERTRKLWLAAPDFGRRTNEARSTRTQAYLYLGRRGQTRAVAILVCQPLPQHSPYAALANESATTVQTLADERVNIRKTPTLPRGARPAFEAPSAFRAHIHTPLTLTSRLL